MVASQIRVQLSAFTQHIVLLRNEDTQTSRNLFHKRNRHSVKRVFYRCFYLYMNISIEVI